MIPFIRYGALTVFGAFARVCLLSGGILATAVSPLVANANLLIQGNVHDITGRPIAGATLTVTPGGESTISDSAGAFYFGPVAYVSDRSGLHSSSHFSFVPDGIRFSGLSGKELRIALYDLRGRCAFSRHLPKITSDNFVFRFDSKIADGMYVTRINVSGTSFIRRVGIVAGIIHWKGSESFRQYASVGSAKIQNIKSLTASMEGYQSATVSLPGDTVLFVRVVLRRPGQEIPEHLPREVAVDVLSESVSDYVCTDHGTNFYKWINGSLKSYHNKCLAVEGVTIPYNRITLDNGLVKVTVAPELGMRVLRATDLTDTTSTELFTSMVPWVTNRWLQGHGGVEPSFPFFETGTATLNQEAGYRIIRHSDGSVTVAMNMRMDHRQTEMDMGFIGKYGDRPLSCWVTLHPGTNMFEVTYRAENPNPTRRSDRMWTNSFFPNRSGNEKPEKLFPTYWAMDHAATSVWAAQGEISRVHSSNFALYPEMPFSGGWYPGEKVNRLRIVDPVAAPGCKLYDGGESYFEIWGGTNALFEAPEEFVAPYEPIETAQKFYLTRNIGKVEYANEHVAVSLSSDSTFEMTAPRYGVVSVSSKGSPVVTDSPIGPTQVVSGRFQDSIIVVIDGSIVYEGPLPIVLNPDSSRLADVRQSARMSWGWKNADGYTRFDLENDQTGKFARNIELEGHQSRWETLSCFAVLLSKPSTTAGFEACMSLANTCYRLGRFTFAQNFLYGAERCSEADTGRIDYLRGLISWERGDTVDFVSADAQSYYHRALQAIAAKDLEKATGFLRTYLEWNPSAFRPRLVLAYLTEDRLLAARCLNENPGSPEALAVLSELGYAPAQSDLATLVSTRTGADIALENFRNEMKNGIWRHGRRYEYTPAALGEELAFPVFLKYGTDEADR